MAGPDVGAKFSGIFLGYMIIAGFIAIVFLLYLNRVIASLLSWGIRTWSWNAYGVYIDIQALQVSLLGGRVFFVGLRYHGNNETILVQHGHITWQYWLWRVRGVDLTKSVKGDDGKDASQVEDGHDGKPSRLPCRMTVSLAGLEWFVYNRSPAYDAVLAGMTEDSATIPPEQGDVPAASKLRRRHRASEDKAALEKDSPIAPSYHLPDEEKSIMSARQHAHADPLPIQTSESDDEGKGLERKATHREADLPLMLQLLPIQFKCDRAALVMGNETTPAILIVKTKGLSGEIDAAATSTPDPYRQLYKLKFENPVVEIKDNEDFKEGLSEKATREKQLARETEPTPRRSFLRRYHRKTMHQLRNLVPWWRKSVESFSPDSQSRQGTAASQVPGSIHWHGLSRYLDDYDRDEKGRWAGIEYAAVTTILDTPEACLTIYWDAAGRVTTSSRRRSTGKARGRDAPIKINGDEPPPAWGITLSIKGGTVNYGPWADRHRAKLQQTFFPTLSKDAEPAQALPVGAERVPTQFKLYVELDEDVTLRIPIREESKNWRYRDKEPGLKTDQGRNRRRGRSRFRKTDQGGASTYERQYGWLDIKIAANTAVSYSMDMLAGPNGYTNTLDLDMPNTEISSSINHEVLWRSGTQRISCDLSTPLKWNGLRQWRFDIKSDDLELFLLRDHVFLLIDLVDDWTTGPPPEYLVFTPFKYYLDFHLKNVKLYLNVNDANIINKPTDFNDNTYLEIGSPLLESSASIPIDRYRPSKNTIPFDVRTETAVINLHVPPWNTQATFLSSKDIGHLENLVLDGKYHYNATTSPANTDALVLNLSGQSPVVHLYGFVIRYFLKLKDNYFGDDVHFKTLDEYQDMLRLKETDPEAENTNKPPPKRSNDLDVILSVRADDPKVFLPANLYSCAQHVQIDAASLSADLRFTNYYMDMEFALSPMSLSLGSGDDPLGTPESATSSTQLFIDGICVDGHRLFGLPPTEATYMCNWDLSVGAITGECTADFLTSLMRGGKSFGFSFDDDENALIPYSSVVMYDITFLRVFVQSIRIWLHVDEAAFLLSTGSIDVKYNDWARSHYSRRANIRVPDIQFSCVNSETAARHKSRSQSPIQPDALVHTSLHLAIIGRKFAFSQERKLQQEHVRREDQRTHRTEFLIVPGLLQEPLIPDRTDPPAQPVPPIPLPTLTADLQDDKISLSSTGTSRRSWGLRHKASFLSMSSMSQSSILRPHSSTQSRRFSKATDSLHVRQFEPEGTSPHGEHATHNRQVSASTGHHSAFYTAPGDFSDRREQMHNTVAFSSQYFAPYFPLESVFPDSSDTAVPSVEADDDFSEGIDFNLEDIDPSLLGEDYTYSSVLIELPAGLTAFVTPVSLRYFATLMSSLQPSDPEDVLDVLQVDAMADIAKMQKQHKMKGDVADILLRIPKLNVRFINASDLDSPDPSQEEQDQYNVSLTKLALATRSESKWEDSFRAETKQARDSFHLTLGSIELSAAERFADMLDTQAAVKAEVENVMVSLGSKDVKYLDGDIGSIRCSTSSEKIEYLASLIHRTTMLATTLQPLFSTVACREEQLLKYLTYRLIADGQSVVDPTFLVRPSAVLRSAPQHLRTFDSWKLVTRIRQMWYTLDPRSQDQLRLDCLGHNFEVPVDVKEQVVAAFERWRSWDLNNVPQAILLKHVFGPALDGLPSTVAELPFLAVFRVREAAIVLDPGPKQNEIALLDLTARLHSGYEITETLPDDEAVKRRKRQLSVLNVYCGDARIRLNWELCELAEDVLRLYSRMRDETQPQPSPVPPRKHKAVTGERTLHVVLDIGQGSVDFDAVNLNSASLGSGMKASLLMRNGSNNLEDTDFILSCDAVTSRIRSHSQLLSQFQLRKPSVIISHSLQATETTDEHTIKASASSKQLSLVIKQDPIALLEVFDLLMKDEVAQLYRLKQQLPSASRPRPRSRKIVDRLSAFRVNLTMFLEEYTISTPLLQSITYTISGVVARAAMAANFGKEVIFDFDVKENSHEMQINVNNQPRSISLLQIPPTNGRITSHMGDGDHLLSVFASVELIQLDASAVYSLLSALNRPEISSAISDIQEQAKMIQKHANEIFEIDVEEKPVSLRSDEPSEKQQEPLIYTVHLTFAGLQVFGKSPLKSESEPMAHISFGLESVHLALANRLEPRGPVLAHSEFHLNLSRILFEIKRGTESALRRCGHLSFGALITATSRMTEEDTEERFFNVMSNAFDAGLSSETVSTVVDVLGYMGDKIKDLDTSRELEYLRKLRQSRPKIAINDQEEVESDIFDSFFSSSRYSLEFQKIQLAWLIDPPTEEQAAVGREDLILTLRRIEFGTRTRNSARLTIENLQLQMVPPGQDKRLRSLNSALLPEIIFNIAYVSSANTRRMAFQAVGKSLDLRLASGFIIPASNLSESISLSAKNVQQASQHWNPPAKTPSVQSPAPESEEPRRTLLGNKRLESLLVDADFAGAVVYLSGKRASEERSSSWAVRHGVAGKYGQFSSDEASSSTILRSPGLAFKMEYRDNGREDPSLYGEVKIDASSNILYPSVVPLVMDLSSSIKKVVSKETNTNVQPQDVINKAKAVQDDYILTADPSAVIGRLKLNLGLRICRQEFTLSCQPIARVAATASSDDIYFTVNTVHSAEQGNFFAISGAFTNIQASVQHVYSRESTGRFAVDSIDLSFMNSKHVSGISGVSAIMKVSPMQVYINAKQLQDFLLFREIWIPHEVHQGSSAPVANLTTETSQGHLVQRYQQVAATAAFPWTATISIDALEINLDLGQAIGKSIFSINELWVSSKKTSDWEQNLCLGFQRIGVDSTGRMSGSVAMENFRLRTSIQWPEREQALNETPLVQASVGFNQFRVKAAFDYQAFLMSDITKLDFLMYNVRRTREGTSDRLVAIFEGDAVQVFGTTTSVAQSVALYQAFQKLVQERRANFESSLKEIEKFMRRKSVSSPALMPRVSLPKQVDDEILAKSPISLDTDVVVNLKALNLGVFPSTFSDHQVLKMEATNAQARFAASIESRRIHSMLGLTLGQLRIGLAGVRHIEAPKALSELAVEDVVRSATGSRGGTILKVPRVEAEMQTWQAPDSRQIDYIFKSAFEGKVEVGWNYSRISYIRGMWANHSKTLAQTWGRELPPLTASIRVTGVPGEEEQGGERQKQRDQQQEQQQGKITAEVSVPVSKYEYRALEPPVIETPQLRDMGEATPPLEWIGLHRDRLPNLTHQIVIVSLLELAGEVEDAYSRILGSS
ncbi:Fermentation associated protein [Pleurostoma richardsiae]|uniref:Fermentation associated protein n=1 Tax=Pleurostoma richardsiae TaxID=41990 RepID=A0AA38RD32_9PEZI|nr:Fermentation associated protein [Pleurostoma richardsiae]